MTKHEIAIGKSKRLRRVYDYIKHHGNPTGLDIVLGAKISNLTAGISELRSKGINIVCERSGVSENGCSVNRYRIVFEEQAELFGGKDKDNPFFK